MRELSVQRIADAVEELCIRACYELPHDVVHALEKAKDREPWPQAKDLLREICQNADIAKKGELPICQDTGMACVFLTLGQDVHLTDGALDQAVDEGVRRGYINGYLRKSIVADPLRRANTLDNTPALLHVDVVPGDACAVTVLPKGFGSENMSRVAMLNPADGKDGVMRFVIETVVSAGSNPCPPVIVGVGVGSSFDGVTFLAKKALLRELGSVHRDAYYAAMEAELLEAINQSGVGPQGYGGLTTALCVFINAAPTHIASLPVAVNLSCHATRRLSMEL
jgi:fumarate hydratase subunit alpha